MAVASGDTSHCHGSVNVSWEIIQLSDIERIGDMGRGVTTAGER